MKGCSPLPCQVGDNLVDIHIGLGAAAGLPNHQGKLAGPLPLPDLPANSGDRVCPALVQLAKGSVGLGAGIFKEGKSLDNLLRLALSADPKVLEAPLGLRPPVAVRRNGDLPHGVVFHTIFHNCPPVTDKSFYFWLSVQAFPTASATFWEMPGSKMLGMIQWADRFSSGTASAMA